MSYVLFFARRAQSTGVVAVERDHRELYVKAYAMQSTRERQLIPVQSALGRRAGPTGSSPTMRDAAAEAPLNRRSLLSIEKSAKMEFFMLFVTFLVRLLVVCLLSVSVDSFVGLPECEAAQIIRKSHALMETRPNTALIATAREASIGSELRAFVGVLSALIERLGKILFSPTMLAKAVPNMVSFLPNLIGGMMTNMLELTIDCVLRLVAWAEPAGDILEAAGRALNESFIGRLLTWDAIDSGLRLMRVRRNCRSKAACECGSYVFQRNNRLAASTMKASHGLPLLMFLILIVIVPTCHCSIVTSWGGPGSLERYILDAFQLMKTLAMHAWRIFFTRSMLIKALPKVVDFLPTVAKDFITNTIDFLVEYGKWFVDWIDPSATIIEISERTLTNSFIGRLVYRDIIDYGLQLMRVPKNCQTKAACELGAYVLHRNQRVAGFLKAMRAHFSKISMHWPAMMNGLRGEICEELYSSCPQNFIMAKPQSRLQRPKKNENKNVKSSTR
ncbi:hypothetical protein BIW11_13726, partial [Tropilaelaps mercedesae]